MSEKRKKHVLGALLILLGLYLYFAKALSPVKAETARIQLQLAAAQELILAASGELEHLQAAEKAAAGQIVRDAAAERLTQTIPSAYLLEIPPTLQKTLGEHSVAGAKADIFLLLPFPGRPDLALAGWNVQAPEAGALAIGEALAHLENRFPMGRIVELSLVATPARDSVHFSMLFQTAIQP